MNIKELFKNHILTILSALAIIALFMPFLSINTEIDSAFGSTKSSVTTTGFRAIGEAFLGWGLIIGPVLLIAMNYVKRLENRKGLLAITIPFACILIEIVTFFQAKGASAAASGGNGMVEMDVKASIGIGFILLILIYVGMIISGAVLYHNFTLNKAGLERLKAEGADLLGDGFDKIKEGGANIINSTGKKISSVQSNVAATTADNGTQKTIKKPVNASKAADTLQLIEKLATMKDNGVLTEEEFSAKKQELLEEI